MKAVRQCSRTACSEPAVATLTYVYADSTAVLGPLATFAEPHCYDLCRTHADGLTAPLGWEVVRLAPDASTSGPSHDDLVALAEAVREVGRRSVHPDDTSPRHELGQTEVSRRGHLRMLKEESEN